ncbi:MAG: ABC transporter permease subunit [Roseburia sp.]|nr:ABC transporter permease subunit [Roseburia sp.]
MGTLFFYELKKIVNRKIMWIGMLISILLILFTVGSPLVGDYFVNGERIGSNYEMFQIDAAYQKALDGKVIDEALLLEMQEAYSKVPLDAEQYSLTEEYQKYARPYSAIYNYVRQVADLSGMEMLNWVVSTEDLHARRLANQETRWEEYLLSDVEKEFWREQETQIENPVVYRYGEGYYILFSAAYTVGLLTVFMVSVCLAGVFPEEHVRKTDQMILSSKYGRKDVFWAKFAAGVLVAFFMALVFVVIAFVMTLILYGLDGFDMAFQIIYAGSSCPISAGEAVLIIYAIVLCAGVFTGAIVMMLSEVLHSSVGTLAIAIGMIILPMMVTIPDEYRLLAQLWSYLPSDIVAGWSCFSPRTVVMFGTVFQAWQVVPVLYTVIGTIAAVATKRVFVKYQVSGR